MTSKKAPCLFIICTSVNPEAGTAISDYISVRGGMNIYSGPGEEVSNRLDFENAENGDRFLQEGLAQATHVLALISSEIPEPWWFKRLPDLAVACGVEPAVLTLKGMAEVPHVPQAVEVLRGIKSLNEYLFRVSPQVGEIIFNNPEYGGLMAHTAPNHPLDAFLDWEH